MTAAPLRDEEEVEDSGKKE